MECYLLFTKPAESIESITFEKNDESKTSCTVYCVHTPNIPAWSIKLKTKPAKFFIQNPDLSLTYTDNGLYKSLFNNLPLPWVQFIFQNENQVLRLSQDLELIAKNDVILPRVQDVFKILRLIKPKRIKAIIIGQDPYPQAQIADGIAFSTFSSNSIPASLKNIFKELEDYENVKVDTSDGDLTRWVSQGCLLINSAWTVSENKIGSHSNLWKGIVENLLRYILEVNGGKKIPIAFFGADAKTKFRNVVKAYSNSILLTTWHPSPQTADKGFFNSQIFLHINEHLNEPIDWR